MDNNHETSTLQHHGVKGMKWGVRRYQRKDGSLTALGEKRMGIKSGADKKAIEDLKDRRAARKLNIQKQRQDMRQDKLDRENNRALERAKIKLAQKKAQDESADQAANRKLLKSKLQQDKEAQKQDALDRATNRKLAKDKMKMDRDEVKSKTKTLPDDDYYELPDTPERQRSSGISGKQLAGAALGIAGGIAIAAAVKKFGPAIIKNMQGSKMSNTVKNAAKNVKDNKEGYKDFAMEVFREASKYRGVASVSSNSSNTPLLGAPSSSAKSTVDSVSSIMETIGNIPLYLGS